jgi:hypothetical protein
MTDSKQSQGNAPPTNLNSTDALLTLLISKQLEKDNPSPQETAIERNWLKLWRIVASHVLMLILGATSIGLWMLENDTWRDYVTFGCKLDPSHYQSISIPEPYPIKSGGSVADYIWWLEMRELQLMNAMNDAGIRMDYIANICEGVKKEPAI